MATSVPIAGPIRPAEAADVGDSGRLSHWLVWILPLLAFANAVGYVAYAGNPLVASDAWYFLEAFLQKAMDAGPAMQDFFVKRDGADHAQPLVKLLLWANAEWFGLDFVVEALAGVLFAALVFIVLKRSLRGARMDSVTFTGIGTMALALVTLNAGMVFNWSLVSLTYLIYFLAVLTYAAAWRVLETGRGMGWMLASALLVAFSLDDVGLIIALSLAIASVLGGLRRGDWSGVWRVLVALVVAELAYFAFTRLFLPGSPGVVDGQLGQSAIGAVLSRIGDAPEVARVVFGSTLAHIHTLTYYAGDNAPRWQGVLAALAVLAHVWFWWQAARARWTASVFQAVSIMLLFYGMMAGIIVSRLPTYGVNYLHEPRYAVFYLLSNVALILMLIGRPRSGSNRAPRVGGRLPALAALVFVALLQVPLSWYTWRDGRYLHTYYHSMAAQMYALGNGRQPESCVPLLTVCQAPAAERERVIDFLERHRLNAFSPAFVARYRLQNLAPMEQHAMQ